jgi:hypothetical protein
MKGQSQVVKKRSDVWTRHPASSLNYFCALLVDTLKL